MTKANDPIADGTQSELHQALSQESLGDVPPLAAPEDATDSLVNPPDTVDWTVQNKNKEPTSKEQTTSDEAEKWKAEAEKWEQEAKKYQSFYDKELSDWKNLKAVLEQRPDLVQMLAQGIVNPPKQEEEEKIDLGESGFDPYDAVENPESPSAKLLEKRQRKLIREEVSNSIAALQEQLLKMQLQNRIVSDYGFTPDQASKFIDFYQRPKEDLPMDVLIDVFKRVEGAEDETTTHLPTRVASKVNQRKQAVQSPAAYSQSDTRPITGTKQEADQFFDAVLDASKRMRRF